MTIEEAYKLGWNAGYHTEGSITESADKAWIDFRRAQIVKERGKLAAVEYYTNAINRLNSKKEESKAVKDLKCPNCTGPMVYRLNKVKNSKFWGCKQFPKCKGTRDVNGLSRNDRIDFDSEDSPNYDGWPEG